MRRTQPRLDGRRSGHGYQAWLLSTLATCLLTPALAAPAEAQSPRVASVRGSNLTLSVGSDAGVTVGATGKLCGTEQVGGQAIEVCPAKFKVTAATATSSTASVTAGDASAVTSGMAARFDKKLEPRPAPPPASTSGSGSAADDALKQADRLYDGKQYAQAAKAYRDFLAAYPNHASAEYAKGMATAAEGKVVVASPAKPAATPAPRPTPSTPPVMAATSTPTPAAGSATTLPSATVAPVGTRGRWTITKCNLTTRMTGGGSVSSLRPAAGMLELIETRYLEAGAAVADLRELRVLFTGVGKARVGPHAERGAESDFIERIAPELSFTPAWVDGKPRDFECILVRTAS